MAQAAREEAAQGGGRSRSRSRGRCARAGVGHSCDTADDSTAGECSSHFCVGDRSSDGATGRCQQKGKGKRGKQRDQAEEQAQGKGGDVSPAKKVPKSGTPAPIKSVAEVFAGIATPAPVKFVTGEAFAELIPSPLTGKAEARFAGKSYSEAAAAVMYLPPATEA